MKNEKCRVRSYGVWKVNLMVPSADLVDMPLLIFNFQEKKNHVRTFKMG